MSSLLVAPDIKIGTTRRPVDVTYRRGSLASIHRSAEGVVGVASTKKAS